MKDDTKETMYATLPRIVENLLIFPSKDNSKSSYLICYDYRHAKAKLLNGGRLLLGSKFLNKEEYAPPEHVFVLGQTMHIFCLKWKTLLNENYTDLYEVPQLFNLDDDINAVYKLKTSTADDKIDELIEVDINSVVYD